MAHDRYKTGRREFLQLMGLGTAAALNSSIAKALAIPAHSCYCDLRDVEHIIILTQENNSFDEYFGTLKGVRGFADPRVAKQPNGNSVFLQPATTTVGGEAKGYPKNGVTYGWPAHQYGGVTQDLVVPPFRIDPAAATTSNAPSDLGAITNLGLVYRADLSHGWPDGNGAWNRGQWNGWVAAKNPLTMSYQRREDIPYHSALADAFTVGDNYFCALRSSTNPNRCYLWSGCIGNIPGNVLPDGTPTAKGTNGNGGGIVTGNGYVNGHALSWPTYPEMLQNAGVSWRIYQDIFGDPIKDKGDGGPLPVGVTVNTAFIGTYTDNPVLYFQQWADAPTTSPLFQQGATGTSLVNSVPLASAPRSQWESWAQGLFEHFQSDVQNGTLPQVSWLVAPAGYTEHPAYPSNYGAWYISQVLDILTANPTVFSKTVLIINYDENDGFFDHIPAPVPALSTDGSDGATTIAADYEQVPGAAPTPIGLGFRVPLLVISPWSKGGYVNSEVLDHTSVLRFIEQRFGVPCPNISPWRRAVSGDLTSCFNFSNPNAKIPHLPDTSSYLPLELGTVGGANLVPSSASQIALGIPAQERGVRPARALPYEMHVLASISGSVVSLKFSNSGRRAVVFHVRSGDGAAPRSYTVEPGKSLTGSWTVDLMYDLTVHGPNGFLRSFKGSVDDVATLLAVETVFGREGYGSVGLKLGNLCKAGKNGRGRRSEACVVRVLDAYTGKTVPVGFSRHGELLTRSWQLDRFFGWYDLVITVEDDPSFEMRLAGHVETGRESFSDPAMGGLVTLKVSV